jgi:hypothetical protein
MQYMRWYYVIVEQNIIYANELKRFFYYIKRMAIIHDIFVNDSITADRISEIKNIMYTVDAYNTYRAGVNLASDKTITNEKVVLTDIADESIVPESRDHLFWCCYIGHYGIKQYNDLKHRAGNEGMEEKQRISEHFKVAPNVLKNINQKMTKDRTQEIMSEIMVNDKVSLNALPAFALYYKMRIIIIKEDRLYLDISSIDGNYDKTILIRKTNNKTHSIDLNANDTKISQIEKDCILLFSHEKPLKAISKFKIDELRDLASKVNVEIEPKTSKTELYGIISRKCIW